MLQIFAIINASSVMYSGKKAQHDFPKMRGGGGVKGRLELFQKFIRFGRVIHPFVKVNQNNTSFETAMLSQSKIGEMLSVQVRCYALSDQIFGHHGDPHKR